MSTIPLLVITGPTASGKSALAMELCRRLNGEIISADSMQIHRGCNIVTAKPTPEEQAEIPHHLIDIRNPDERYSAAQWAQDATIIIGNIQSRAKTPIICGGTGFYLRALFHPQSIPANAPSEEVRTELEAESAALDNEQLHAKLRVVNPDLAARLHPNDRYRVLRALEIAHSTPTSTTPISSPYHPLAFALDWPREELYQRIDERVLAMSAAGALQELQSLAEKWDPDAPALGGVGYKQLRPALTDPAVEPACLAQWQQDTRRYAKRQLTWFRHQLDVTWLPAHHSMDELAGAVTVSYQRNTQ